MRISAFILPAVLMQPLCAAESFLVPVHTPTPVFPPELIKTRYAGKVRAQLWIKSDGQVVEAKAIESGHPQLAEAVEQALRQWRYKPWIGTVGAPPQTTITVPVIFGSHGYRRFNTEVTVGLGNIRCGYLNEEVKSARQDYPKESLSKVDVFAYTGQVLFSSHVAHQRTEPQRKALLEQLGASIPTVISTCRRNPDRLFGEYLPAPIKSLLVGLAEHAEGSE
ncbi:TonB domain-containing protein [Pseudomonas syringae pv. cilantro]|uniref:TonB domain-containing protein n=2 Tax=Pseudomonas syringae group TaxID=136849 RepID=A0A0N1JQ39_PSESX|nr:MULTISPECIES: energy transducer TonB [Pseudomonas syringae group]KPC35685.1 TonB domain-containing protein [Pseudomonas syringae pv. cilantro]KPW71857.1 TonB domain-containing protein [Pseudomonas syringae pv. coriandricola]RMN15250.1 TonB domain-containing protein [Pseudomonas syringae pv. coriandricola]